MISASTLLSQCAQWASHKVNPGVYVDCRMPRPDILIRSDRGSIEEVLMKMLSNAAKFTSKGSITLECVDNGPDGTVSFVITDTGSGIPATMKRRYSKDSSSLILSSRTGLGLYICFKQIATSLHGKIYADPSRPEAQGSCSQFRKNRYSLQSEHIKVNTRRKN